jgi:AcrR family transcriptional regulator
MPEVARGAERAPASVYRRFGDKEALLKAAAEQYLAEVATQNVLAFANPRLTSFVDAKMQSGRTMGIDDTNRLLSIIFQYLGAV